MTNPKMRFDAKEIAGLADYELELPEMRFPASILHGRRMSDDELFGIVTDKHARQGASLKKEEIYFFPACISNQRLDSYFTKMALSSLRNYATDATEGVGFQNSHRNRELSIGRVINGVIEEKAAEDAQNVADGDFPRVLTDVYTVRDLKLTADLSTNDFIRGVEAGIVKDVSIGFKDGEGFSERCSICGNEYWSYDCRHIAGFYYDVPKDPNADPTGQETDERLAFVWIENARLSEVSAVYDGATPNAMILTKAQREERAGRLAPTVRTAIEKRFHIDLNESRRLFAGSSDEEKREQATNENNEEKENNNSMDDKTRADNAEKRVKTISDAARSACKAVGLTVADDATEETVIESLRGEVERLKPLAKQGEDYRAALINEAVTEGARAFGKDFDETKKRAMLEKLSVEEIGEIKTDWAERASSEFKSGRQSKETDDDEQNRSDKNGDESEETDETKQRKSEPVSTQFIPPSNYSTL